MNEKSFVRKLSEDAKRRFIRLFSVLEEIRFPELINDLDSDGKDYIRNLFSIQSTTGPAFYFTKLGRCVEICDLSSGRALRKSLAPAVDYFHDGITAIMEEGITNVDIYELFRFEQALQAIVNVHEPDETVIQSLNDEIKRFAILMGVKLK